MALEVVTTDVPWVDRDFTAIQSALDRFRPDLVIIQIGDNASDVSESGFDGPYEKLLNLVQQYTSRLYLIGAWRLSLVDPFIQQLAISHGAKFIRINDLFHNFFYNYRNQAISEDLCLNNQTIDPNVCWHPGDTGMQAIAEAVCR